MRYNSLIDGFDHYNPPVPIHFSNGFKTFENFSLDLSPFVVILGPNASRKSNLFDAGQFLSNLATRDTGDAIRGLRGEGGALFCCERRGKSVAEMNLAVEVLIEPILTVASPGRT